jgi:hypothetical protein
LQIKDWANLLGALDSKDFSDEFSFEEETIEYEGRTEDGPQEIMLNLENEIEELKDHGLDLIIKGEAPMQILNLTLQEQHQNILEGLISKDDDYADWIKCAIIKEDARTQQRLKKNNEPNAHLYLVQMTNDLIKEDNRWT